MMDTSPLPAPACGRQGRGVGGFGKLFSEEIANRAFYQPLGGFLVFSLVEKFIQMLP